MTLNDIIAFILRFSPNSIALQANYVTVVKDRPIMIVNIVSRFQFKTYYMSLLKRVIYEVGSCGSRTIQGVINWLTWPRLHVLRESLLLHDRQTDLRRHIANVSTTLKDKKSIFAAFSVEQIAFKRRLRMLNLPPNVTKLASYSVSMNDHWWSSNDWLTHTWFIDTRIVKSLINCDIIRTVCVFNSE